MLCSIPLVDDLIVCRNISKKIRTIGSDDRLLLPFLITFESKKDWYLRKIYICNPKQPYQMYDVSFLVKSKKYNKIYRKLVFYHPEAMKRSYGFILFSALLIEQTMKMLSYFYSFLRLLVASFISLLCFRFSYRTKNSWFEFLFRKKLKT